jgi:hypothetical protein
VGEPVAPRHRRRERRRTGAAPPVPDEAPRDVAAEDPPAGQAPPPPQPAEAAAPPGQAAPLPAQAAPPPGQAAPLPGQAVPPPADVAPPRGQAVPPSGPGSEGEAGAKRKSRARRTDTERGLRGIVGAGPSQVGVLGAMRARDAAKPTAADLAAAERDVVVVRRFYVPPDTLPGARQ